MKLIKKELLDALKKCLPGVDKDNAILQGADTFVFEDGEIFSYNDKISVSVKLSEEMKDIKGTIKANEFFKLLSKLPDDKELFIETTNEKWIIKGDSFKAELSLLKDSIKEYVSILKEVKKEWKDLSIDFFDALKRCKLSINNTTISGIAVKDNKMMSCNGKVLNWFEMENEMCSFWIDNTVVDNLLKFENLNKWCESDKWLFFCNEEEENIYFTCKKQDDSNFPYDSLINTVKDHDESISKTKGELPENLKKAIDRASVLSKNIDGGEETINIVLSNDGIECYSERSTGKYREKIEWEKEINIEKPIKMQIDFNMINYGINKTNQFYVIEKKNDEDILIRVIFYGNKFKCMVSTYAD